jgi:hypothetical protein
MQMATRKFSALGPGEILHASLDERHPADRFLECVLVEKGRCRPSDGPTAILVKCDLRQYWLVQPATRNPSTRPVY